jgi:hypothetical protein
VYSALNIGGGLGALVLDITPPQSDERTADQTATGCGPIANPTNAITVTVSLSELTIATSCIVGIVKWHFKLSLCKIFWITAE